MVYSVNSVIEVISGKHEGIIGKVIKVTSNGWHTVLINENVEIKCRTNVIKIQNNSKTNEIIETIKQECNICVIKKQTIKCSNCNFYCCDTCISKWYKTSGYKCPQCKKINTYKISKMTNRQILKKYKKELLYKVDHFYRILKQNIGTIDNINDIIYLEKCVNLYSFET